MAKLSRPAPDPPPSSDHHEMVANAVYVKVLEKVMTEFQTGDNKFALLERETLKNSQQILQMNDKIDRLSNKLDHNSDETNNLIRGLYDKHPTHSAGSKGSYDQSDIGTSKTSRKELSSKENLPDKPHTRQKPSSQF